MSWQESALAQLYTESKRAEKGCRDWQCTDLTLRIGIHFVFFNECRDDAMMIAQRSNMNKLHPTLYTCMTWAQLYSKGTATYLNSAVQIAVAVI